MVNRTSKKISSLQNPLVKHLVKLKESRSYRESCLEVVVAGEKIVKELQTKAPSLLIVLEGQKPPFPGETIFVSAPVLKKITGLLSAPTCAALFSLPPDHNLTKKKFIVACDRIADPGNLGTLIRSASALGWEGVYLLDASVDLFNDKVVRSSRGGCLKIPFCRGDLKDLVALSKKNGAPIFVADLVGKALQDVPKQKGCILLLGTEGKGHREQALKVGQRVTIPLSQNMESLNVAVAGSILMYALKS